MTASTRRRPRGGMKIAWREALGRRWAEQWRQADAIDLGRELVELRHEGRRTWGDLVR